MIENYLFTFFRNIGRHKLYSFINIGGLVLALAVGTNGRHPKHPLARRLPRVSFQPVR